MGLELQLGLDVEVGAPVVTVVAGCSKAREAGRISPELPLGNVFLVGIYRRVVAGHRLRVVNFDVHNLCLRSSGRSSAAASLIPDELAPHSD